MARLTLRMGCLLAALAVTIGIAYADYVAETKKPKASFDVKGLYTVTTPGFTLTLLKPIKFGFDINGDLTQMRRVSLLQTYTTPQDAKDENGQPTGMKFNRKVSLVIFKCDADGAMLSHMMMLTPDDKLAGQHMDMDKMMEVEKDSPLALIKRKACSMKPPHHDPYINA